MHWATKHHGLKKNLRQVGVCLLGLGWVLDVVFRGAAKDPMMGRRFWVVPTPPNNRLLSLSVSSRRKGRLRAPVVPKEAPTKASERASRSELLRKRRIFRSTLRIEGLREPDHVDLIVKNLSAHTVTITMDITCKNLESTQKLPFTTVLVGKESKKVTRLDLIDGSRPYRYRYHVDMLPGKAKTVPDKDYAYALPYRPGKAFWVVQGYGGKFTHRERSRYSIDFAMPEGTPIYAAREGIVAETKMDSDENGTTEEYRELANYIIVEHPDGTWAEYYHLKENGVQVKVDEKVQTGELIGYSGNTGYSKIPHLHFAVRKTISGKVSSTIPVKFKTSRGVLSRLEPNRRYRAPGVSAE